MSGWTPDWFYNGCKIVLKGEVKEVKSYYFTSDGTHNGDIVVMRFTDGTDHEGFRDVEPATENDLYLFDLKENERKEKKRLKKIEKADKIRAQFRKFLDQQIAYEELAKMYFELKNKVKVEGV